MTTGRIHLVVGLLLGACNLALANTATVYYDSSFTRWGSVYISHNSNGTWSNVSNGLMDKACGHWKTKTIDIGPATQFRAVFTNGAGAWDNNNVANYALTVGISQIKNAVVMLNSSSPCPETDIIPPTVPTGLTKNTVTATSVVLSWAAASDDVGVSGYEIYRNGSFIGSSATTSYVDTNGLLASTPYSYSVRAVDAAGNKSTPSSALQVITGSISINQVKVYYYTTTRGLAAANIHYLPNGGVWSNAPGVAMDENACVGWVLKTISLGSATGLSAAFNNGSNWDNNGGSNYTLSPGLSTVKDGVVTNNAITPCQPVIPDITPPTVPLNPMATATNTSITINWTASIDADGVSGYTLYRNGGTEGNVSLNSGNNTFTDRGLSPQTTYAYSIVAFDAAGNKSTQSASVVIKTGDAVGR